MWSSRQDEKSESSGWGASSGGSASVMGVIVANTSMTGIALRKRAVKAQQGLSGEEKLNCPSYEKSFLY